MTGLIEIKKPIDIATRETAIFLSGHLPAGTQIIEVGCGDGEVAESLSRRGYDVIGLDTDAERVAKAQRRGVRAVEATWPDFHHGPVDAIAFTRSLHHIVSLDDAIKKARQLLKATGLLLIEDFSFNETDQATVEWFVEALHSEQHHSLIRPVERQLVTDLLSAKDPMKVWRESHDPSLHSIATIRQAVSKLFTIRETGSVAYLYRYLVPVLSETPEAAAFVEELFQDETRRGKQNEITLMGRRLVANPK